MPARCQHRRGARHPIHCSILRYLPARPAPASRKVKSAVSRNRTLLILRRSPLARDSVSPIRNVGLSPLGRSALKNKSLPESLPGRNMRLSWVPPSSESPSSQGGLSSAWVSLRPAPAPDAYQVRRPMSPIDAVRRLEARPGSPHERAGLAQIAPARLLLWCETRPPSLER